MHLHDLSDLIASLATLIGALSAFYQVIIKNKRNPPFNKELDKTKKLKKDLKEKDKNDN